MTTFTEIDPAGVVHKRSSISRTYSHTVVFQKSKARAIEYTTSKESIKSYARDGQYYLDCVKNGRHESLMHFAHYASDTERQAKDAAEAAEKLAGATTAHEFAERRITESLAHIESLDWTGWYNAGWCGRRDLAVKLAARYDKAAILEVTAS